MNFNTFLCLLKKLGGEIVYNSYIRLIFNAFTVPTTKRSIRSKLCTKNIIMYTRRYKLKIKVDTYFYNFYCIDFFAVDCTKVKFASQ